MNTQEEENMCTQYTIVSLNFIPQALPAGITCKLNSTDNLLWTLFYDPLSVASTRFDGSFNI